jgi:hypothetical protein
MVTGNHRFGIQDIIAVAVLAGTVTVLLQSKMEAVGVRLSPALRQVFIEWWPLLLILVGIALLVAHYRSRTAPRYFGKQSRGASLFSTSRGNHES